MKEPATLASPMGDVDIPGEQMTDVGDVETLGERMINEAEDVDFPP